MTRNTDGVGDLDPRRQAGRWFAGTKGFTDDEGYSWTLIPVGNITKEFSPVPEVQQTPTQPSKP